MAKQQVLIDIIGDNADLRKALADTERRLRGLEKKLAQTGASGKKGMGGVAAGMGVAAGATLAASKAFDFLKGSINTTNELTLASAKLGTITKMDAVTSGQWVLMARSRGVGAKQLNTAFITLSKNMSGATHGSKAQAEAFRQLGVSQEALKKGNPHEVMRQVAEGLSKVKSGADKAKLAQQLFGRGSQGLIGVLGGGSKALDESLAKYKGNAEELSKNEGQAKKLAAAKRDLKNALDSVKISLGTALTPVIAQAAKALTAFTNLSPGVKRFILTLAGLAAGAIAVKKLVDAFKAVKLVFTVLRTAMMTNPIGLILTAIAVAAYLIISNWGAVKKFLGATWNWIKTAFRSVANFVISMARKGFLGPVAWIITHWTQVKNFLGGLVGSIGTIAKNIGSALWNGIKSGASAVTGVIKGIVNGYLDNLGSGINLMVDVLNKGIDVFNKIPGPNLGHLGHVSVPHLATGGIVNGARMAMIGEDGPEAVIPLSSKYRARGAALYAQAGAAMGMGGNTFIIHNAQNLDENQLAARFAWQMQTRTA